MEKAEENTKRIEAFSDGVFAFAITLLALDLKITPLEQKATNTNLWNHIIGQWPIFLTFIISFTSVLIMWVNHQGMFRQIYRINSRLIFANGLMLLLVITVPFTTSLLAEYYMTDAANTVTAIYSGSFVLINISYNLLWHIASSSDKLLRDSAIEKTVHRVRKKLLIGLPLYIIAFIVSFFSVDLALMICLGLWIFWAATIRVF